MRIWLGSRDGYEAVLLKNEKRLIGNARRCFHPFLINKRITQARVKYLISNNFQDLHEKWDDKMRNNFLPLFFATIFRVNRHKTIRTYEQRSNALLVSNVFAEMSCFNQSHALLLSMRFIIQNHKISGFTSKCIGNKNFTCNFIVLPWEYHNVEMWNHVIYRYSHSQLTHCTIFQIAIISIHG